MPTGNTTLLGLALPVQGELAGTWGNVINQSITELIDSAVAGTTTLSTNADVTLSTTALAANQARQAVLLWTASNGATTRNITAPAQSKAYIVINAGTGSVVLRGAGTPPTTGITIVSGERCLAAWSGSDFVKVASSLVDGVATISFGTTGLTPSTATSGAVTVAGTLAVANGGTGVTTSTGTGSTVRSTSPTLTTPNLGTPSAATLTNATGLPISTGVSGLGTGVATALAVNTGTAGAFVVNGGALGTPASGTLTNATGLPISTGVSGLGTGVATALAVNTGTAGAFVVNGGALGTPASGTLTNATDLPISTGVSGLGTGVATFLATPSSANLAAAVTNETGSGALVFATSPTLVTPALGTPSSATLTNATGLPISTGVSGLGTGVATFLATPSSANLQSAVTDETGTGALVFATSPTLVTPNLGTPASGVVTNLTGTASININGTVGATTANTGAFTTLTASTAINSSRINSRVSSAASAASITPDVAAFDMYALTAQAAALTINAPTGTPLDGNKLIFRILDNGTSRALTWNATYTSVGVVLPAATVVSKILYVGCIYNAANTRWDVISVTVQA